MVCSSWSEHDDLEWLEHRHRDTSDLPCTDPIRRDDVPPCQAFSDRVGLLGRLAVDVRAG